MRKKSKSLTYGSMINTYKKTDTKLDLSESQQYDKESISEKEIVTNHESVEEEELEFDIERELQGKSELEQLELLSQMYPI